MYLTDFAMDDDNSTIAPQLPLWRMLLVMLLGLGAIGCGSGNVQFQIMRPAAINVNEHADGDGASVAIADWELADEQWSKHAREIDGSLREIIGEVDVVELVDDGGVVTLQATLTEHSFEEKVTTEQKKCSKAQGKKVVQVPCTHATRRGHALVRVDLRALGRDGATIATKTMSCEVDSDKTETDANMVGALGAIAGGMLQQVTGGLANADAVGDVTSAALDPTKGDGLGEPVEPFPPHATTTAIDGDPGTIDWDGVLRVCRKRVARQMAKMVVPYKVTVSKPWLDCGDGDEACQGALVQLQASNYETARELVDLALSQAQRSGDDEAIAGAHWALALVATAMADFETAKTHLKMCIRFDPSQELFANELRLVKTREKEHAELMAQGAGGDAPKSHEKTQNATTADADTDETDTNDAASSRADASDADDSESEDG